MPLLRPARPAPQADAGFSHEFFRVWDVNWADRFKYTRWAVGLTANQLFRYLVAIGEAGPPPDPATAKGPFEARRMTGQQALHAIVRGARPTCVQFSRRIGAARNLGWIDRALKIRREPPPYA